MLPLAYVSIIKIRWLAILLGLFATTAAAETIKPYRTAKPPQQRIGAALVPTMVTIPSGCFQMGSPETENGRDSNETLHRLCINSFKLGKYEITLAEFKLFITATGYRTDAERNVEQQGCWSYQPDAMPPWDWWPWATWQNPVQNMAINDDKPVSCLSFDDVNAYITWLNKETGHHYRLPTEAEWEYASLGGDKTKGYRYSGSDSLEEVGWIAGNAGNKTHPVGQKKPNELGLYDMSGNAWEWCVDYWQTPYADGAATDPTGPAKGENRVNRGGSWRSGAESCRAVLRDSNPPDYRGPGFRLLRSGL